MVVEAQAEADAEIRAELELVLKVQAAFVRPIVTVGVPLQEVSVDEAVRRVGHGTAREETQEIVETDRARVRSSIAGIELRVRETAAESNGVFAVVPNGVGGRHPTVLENTGE